MRRVRADVRVRAKRAARLRGRGGMTQPIERSDWLDGLRLVSRRDVDVSCLFESPAVAIETLTQELQFVWDRYRSADASERRGGVIELASGAYFQWIGYSDRIAVECSSNEFLEPAHQLSAEEEERLVHWGFSRPTDELPNFWMDVTRREDAAAAAFAIVAVMTTVFGMYAG